MHGTDAGRTTPDAPATSVEDTLLHELMRGFSAPGENAALSMGFVGSQTHKPHVPQHCVDTCLRHDANAVFSRGCPFLLSAARNRPDATFLQNGRCARGYRIHAEASSIGNDKVVLLTVAGDHVAPVGEMAEKEVVTHLQRASQMVMRLGQVFEEHTGFADEILLNYEQLNAIFDLTRQIAHVPDVQQIKRILLDRVSLLLHCSPVWIATLDEAGLRPAEDMPRREAFPATLHNSRTAIEVVERVRAQREMAVADVEGFCLLAAPFACDAEQIDVVVAIREQHAEPFNSCDLQLVEAVLTFGAQIISNTLMHERIRRISIQVTRAMLRALDSKDHYTSDHSSRGGFLTLITAKEYGVSEEELRDFEWAGLLHDVGKIGIPEAILCKPGKLTKEEFDIIKQHPRVGYEILRPIEGFETVRQGVLHHHEYRDGTGYPDGLKGDDIPLVAQIIHVVDTFDALTSTRSYRKAFSVDRAMAIIREEVGTRVDAKVANAFFRAFDRYRTEDPEDYAERFASVREHDDDD